MKLNEKGLSLVELLATITIVSIIVVSIIYVFTQFQHSARQQKTLTDAVNMSRTVLEELKWGLPKHEIAAVTLFEDNQTLDLAPFRDPAMQPYEYSELYYPSSSKRHYQIHIKTINFSKTMQHNHITLHIENYFRNIEISVIDMLNGSVVYTLQSYVEYNQ